MEMLEIQEENLIDIMECELRDIEVLKNDPNTFYQEVEPGIYKEEDAHARRMAQELFANADIDACLLILSMDDLDRYIDECFDNIDVFEASEEEIEEAVAVRPGLFQRVRNGLVGMVSVPTNKSGFLPKPGYIHVL